MVTLSQSTTTTRKIIVFGILAIILLIIVSYILRLASSIFVAIFPPAAPLPTVLFGKLPPLPFAQNSFVTPITYSVNTLSGTLPKLPVQERVYRIAQPQPNLISFQNVQTLVNQTEFQQVQPNPVTDTIYQWTLPNPPNKQLTFDILTFNFTLTSKYNTDPTVLAGAHIGNQSDAVGAAKNFFQSLNSYPPDIDETKTLTTLFSIKNGFLFPASSLSTTQVMRVDFFQKDHNNLHIFSSQPPHSVITALVASADNGTQIVEAQYFAKTIMDDYSTYPLKTAQEAYSDLQKGKAYIAAYQGQGNQVTINNVDVGYYEGEGQQLFLMPIIIFEGNDGFMAYVSGIKDNWINNTSTKL